MCVWQFDLLGLVSACVFHLKNDLPISFFLYSVLHERLLKIEIILRCTLVKYVLYCVIFSVHFRTVGAMGRRSQVKKKERRKEQKRKKRSRKRLQHTCISNGSVTNQMFDDKPLRVSGSANNSAFDREESPTLSFGSPGSPPPSCTSSPSSYIETESPRNAFENILGIDSDALNAELDAVYDFEKPQLGEKLKGEELVSYLKRSNSKLAEKVHHYRSEYESLQSEFQKCEQKCKDSVDHIRHFYRDLIYYGTSQGAQMLKASYQKTYNK